jgi:nitrite reductase/ring-hydroxylating ferredoxin subunit
MCTHQHDASTTNSSPAPLDRRAFLRNSALFAVGVLVAQGLSPDAALADQARFIEPLETTARERTYGLPTHDSVSVDEAQRLIIVRANNRVYAFSLECPHRGRLLEWQPDGPQFYCPKHKARYSTEGANIGGRKTSALDRYALRRDGARVVVTLDQLLSATDTPAEWKAAVVSV